jgi:hypothetical protein
MSLFAALLLAAPLSPPAERLALGMSETALASELQSACDEARRLEPADVGFPLAAEQEAHWVCEGGPAGGLERSVFVIADGVLVFASFVGDSELLEPSGDAFDAFGYRVWEDRGVFVHAETDTTWWLDAGGLHANLFAWRHPLLDGDPQPTWSRAGFVVPPEVRFGETLQALEPEVEAACAFTVTRELEPSLPTQPSTQTQIDCFGYEVAGFPRKIEFGDGRLELVWILTGRGEEQRLRAALIADHGSAESLIPGMEFFDDRRVALRTDKPELMMASEAVLEAYFSQP